MELISQLLYSGEQMMDIHGWMIQTQLVVQVMEVRFVHCCLMQTISQNQHIGELLNQVGSCRLQTKLMC